MGLEGASRQYTNVHVREASDILPQREVVKSRTFQVRGHHLGRMRWVQKNLSVGIAEDMMEAMAAIEANTYRADLLRISENIQRRGPNEKDEADLRYIHDLVGSTKADFEQFRERAISFYKEFDSLGEEDDVEIIASKDTLCRMGCKVGAHCQIASALYGNAGTTRKSRDVYGIFLMRREIARFGLENEVEEFIGTTDYIDLENKPVACLRMKAPVFRKIILQSEAFGESALQD